MAKREDMAVKKKKNQKKKDLTPFIIIGVVAVVAVVIIILSQVKPAIEVNVPDRVKADQTDGMTMGDPNAKVYVVEFADFQCPYCGVYWEQMEPSLISDYINTGKVYYTYSPFSFVGSYVTDNPWDESIKSAEAAFCANEQGYFWEYRDLLFGNQNGENEGGFARENLLAFAKKLPLDYDAFEECFESSKYNQSVLDANSYAQNEGVTYSPAFKVNGTVVNANELLDAIDAALK